MHKSTPEFHQELAWELTKKSLHEHRIQRSVIKIQAFAVDSRSSARELIGYNVIDLHNVHLSKPNTKWYQLLHCRYSKMKPELRIGVYLEEQFDSTSLDLKAQFPLFKDLKPIWHSDNGDYYQLGPADKCKTFFTISVTILSASHLSNLIPTEQLSFYSEKEYFFLYNLFGCNISTERFKNLECTNFLPERTSVRVRSNMEALRFYLEQHSPFVINFFCSANPVPLGVCKLSLLDVLPSTEKELQQGPVNIEKSHNLIGNNLTCEKGQHPAVNVGISIHIDSSGSRYPSISQKSPVTKHEHEVVPSKVRFINCLNEYYLIYIFRMQIHLR